MTRHLDLRFARRLTLAMGLVTPACVLINDFGETDDTGPASDTSTETAQTESGEGTLGATSSVLATGAEEESTGEDQTGTITASSGGTQGVSHDEQILPIWQQSCVMAACHSAVDSPSGLDLESEGVRDRICKGIHAFSGMSYIDCEGGDPQASYLFRKLEGTHIDVPGGSGAPMPLLGPLDPEQLDLIEAWILGGALP